MEDKRTISLCIPTYNRVDMTLQAFENVYEDERISEIIIVDDASDLEIFNELKEFCDLIPKINLYRNLTNQDCYFNKATAVGYATNERAILLDSDNIIGKDYLDRLYEIKDWDFNTIYTPSFASPHFDFRAYEGMIITRENVAEWIDKPMAEVCLNAANYFVDVYKYLEVFDSKTNPVTSDSIYQCYNWLLDGGKIEIVNGLIYQHKVHSGSHYQNNVARTPNGFHENILQQLRNMK